MPFLDETVEILNNKWLSSFPTIEGEKFAYGVAETMLVAKEDGDGVRTIRYPGVMTNEGEVLQVSSDDRLPIVLYHKIESISNGLTARGFGDDIGDNTEVISMSLIVIAFRNLVLKPPYWIEAVLKSSLPATLNFEGQQRSVVKAGNSSFDKLGLLAREFSEIELNYPNVIFFEMKYRIENTYKKSCLKNL